MAGRMPAPRSILLRQIAVKKAIRGTDLQGDSDCHHRIDVSSPTSRVAGMPRLAPAAVPTWPVQRGRKSRRSAAGKWVSRAAPRRPRIQNERSSLPVVRSSDIVRRCGNHFVV